MTIDTPDGIRLPTALEIKLLRRKMGWSAARLGEEWGVSRSYIKHLESETDPWPVRPRLAIRFRALQKRVHQASRWQVTERMVLFSKFKMPPQLVVLVRPRKCRGHRRYCIFASRHQKYCGKECQALWLARYPRKNKGHSRRQKAMPTRARKRHVHVAARHRP